MKLIDIAIIPAILIAACVSTTNADELNNYNVYGQDAKTGLYVSAIMWETDKSGNVKARVLDKLDVFDDCRGTWQGKGVAKVTCSNLYEYVLKVVEK